MIATLKKYFRNQIEEINEDTALRYYGSCLAFGQLLSAFYWIASSKIRYLSNTHMPVCWPFFENCFEYRLFSLEEVKNIVIVFGLLSFIGMILFLFRRKISWAYMCLIGINIFQALIYMQDYRLRMNQHYMLFVLTFAFLFFPNKRNLLRYMLVTIYIWAGALKLNMEWISGEALYDDLWFIKGKMVPLACIYTIILEMFIVLGLLVRKRWIYWGTFFQIMLFHFMSYAIVYYYYPILMFALLMIFPLTYFVKSDREPENLLRSFLKGREHVTTYILIAFFSICQIFPYLMPGDSRITGEGRLFALHMFDALVKCEGEMTIKYKDGRVDKKIIPMTRRKRVRCDPAVYFSVAKWHCYQNRDNPNFQDIDVFYTSQRKLAPRPEPVMDIKNFCQKNLNYKMLKRNPWIQIQKR